MAGMRLGAREFRPRLVPTLATLVLLPILIGLGVWQLQRADEKREILAEYQARGSGEPVYVRSAQVQGDLEYYRARAEGRFDGTHQLLLDNKIWQGQPGFEVVTPLKLAGGGAVLVNRGWVPMGRTRQVLPQPQVPDGPVTVRGTLNRPARPGIVLGPADRGRGEWPKLIQYVALDRLERQLGMELVPYVLLLGEDQPHGFKRQWEVLPFGPERHIGYAVQWFALALALMVIFLVVNLRRIDERAGDE